MANFATFVGTLIGILGVAWAFLILFPADAEALWYVLPVAGLGAFLASKWLIRVSAPTLQRALSQLGGTLRFLSMDVQGEDVAGYRRYLYNHVPLAGGWFRRWAADTLAKDGSPAAAGLLAEFLARGQDVRGRDIALAALQRLTDQRAVDKVCGVWATERHPILAHLVEQKRWMASVPTEVRVLSALLVNDLDVVIQGNAAVIAPLVRACRDVDRTIAERARRAVCLLEDEGAKDALCRLAVEQDDPVARDAVLELAYTPTDEQLRALFFFVTEQWERYDLLDFDRRLLHTAYATASSPLKQRIREKLRSTGRADFLSIVAGDDYDDRIAEMASSEVDLLVQTLVANREWPKLWKLVSEVSFVRSVHIVDTLARNAWCPTSGDERAVFEELAALVGQGLLMSIEDVKKLFPLTLQDQVPGQSLLPPALLRAQARVPGRINDMAFSPKRPVIAVGTGRRKVVLWNYQRAERERVLGGFDRSIGPVAFMDDGTLLCAERTNRVVNVCAIYGWDEGGDRFLLGRHTGSVTALASLDTPHVISTGRDGNVILWDVPQRREVKRREVTRYYYRYDDWVRDLRVSPDKARGVLLTQFGVNLLVLPGLDKLNRYPGCSKARAADFAPNGTALVIGRSNGSVSVYKFAHRVFFHSQSLTRHTGRMMDVHVLPDHSVAVSASSDGDIRFTSLEKGLGMGSVRAPLDRLTSLRVSPDGSFMAVGSSDALLSLWDLRPLGVWGFFLRPLAETTVMTLPILDVLSESGALSPRAKLALAYVACALRYRFRFDIELDQAPTIMAGEFDIEIEG
jgi:WD40 repeat protein